MASVSKMQIRGIRSFSPDRDETIEFYSPLTMIVGANGCGKTTIIESLKYACTGSLPPNIKNGQSFLNDPCITDSTEVKAHVKLRFQNRSDKTCVAVRSLQVIRKRSKLEFKTLDGVLRTTNNLDEKVSIGMKCSDMDKVISENLGVSPAIVENVIFVHQEESNWPMSEGIVLKRKFDDVFESTRYTKALEAFVKTKKEFASKAKDLKGELMELGAHLHTAKDFRKEIAEYERKADTCDADLQSIARRLEDNDRSMKHWMSIVSASRGKEQKLQQLTLQVTEAERRITDGKRNLGDRLDARPDAVLQDVLQNFEATVAAQRENMRRLESEMERLTAEIGKRRRIVDDLNLKRGQEDMLKGQLMQLKNKQLALCQEAHRKFAFSAFTNQSFREWNSQLVKEMLEQLSLKMSTATDESAEALTQSAEQMYTHEQECGELKSRLQKVDLELQMVTSQGAELRSECDEKRVELSRLSASRGALQKCQEDFDRAQQQHQEFMNSYTTRSAKVKREIKDASDAIRDLQERISNEDKTLQDLSYQRNDIAALEADLRQTEADTTQLNVHVSTLFQTYRDVLHLSSLDAHTTPEGGSGSATAAAIAHTPSAIIPPQVSTLAELDAFITRLKAQSAELQAKLARDTEQLKRLRNSTSATQALLLQEQSRLRSLEAESETLNRREKNEIKSLCQRLRALRAEKLFHSGAATAAEDGSDYLTLDPDSPTTTPEALARAAKQAEDEAKELMLYGQFRGTFVKKLEKERTRSRENNCPCCKQVMDAEVTARYKENLDRMFMTVSVEEFGSDADKLRVSAECKAIGDAAMHLQAELQPVHKLRADIELSKEKIEEDQATLDVAMKEVTAKERAVVTQTEISERTSRVAILLGEVSLRWQSVEKRKQDCVEKRKRQSQSMLTFSADLGSRSIAELEQDLRDHTEEKDKLQASKEKLVAEESRLEKQCFAVTNLLADRERELSAAKLDGNRYRELDTAITGIQSRLVDLGARQQSMAIDKDRLSSELQDKNMLYVQAKSTHSQTERTWRERLAEIQQQCDALHDAQARVIDLTQRLDDAEFASLSSDLQEAHDAVAEKEQQREEIGQRHSAMKTEISSQEDTKRSIAANLDLRHNEEELRALAQEKEVLELEMGLIGGSGTGTGAAAIKSAERRLRSDQQEQATLTSESDRLQGMMQAHREQIEHLKAKLAGQNYRNVDEKHRRKNIEFETTNMAVADLDKYHNALDKALQNFHTLKIREINKIIRELWQMIYKGQDIDMIEIESGNDDAAGGAGGAATAATSGTARGSRSYNYRVIMRKGDVPLDMRGRCSAGQKVLASIVIRLALAETFCLNCGLLALDEPTTNLDQANKEGLAHALARIIISRSKQHNFQLICITHDEDFVKLMNTELASSAEFSMPEFYFRVYREEVGSSGKFFSHIERIPWEDM